MSAMSTFFGSFSKSQSEDFSGFLSEEINASEEELMKEFIMNIFFRPDEVHTSIEKLRLMTPKVRLASMKNIAPMFDDNSYQRGIMRYKFHQPIKIIAKMAKLPSEVKDGMNLITKQGPEFFPSIERCSNVGDVLADVAESFTTLLKKYKVFEISQARLRREKTKAVKFLVEMMLLYKVDGERAEKMKECMKTISKDENGLVEILEKGNVENLSDLLAKIEEEQCQLVEVETMMVQGSQTLNHTNFDKKWTNKQANVYRAEIPVKMVGNGICYVELLAHYLNAKTIRGPAEIGELKAYLYAENKTGSHCHMLVITLQAKDAHSVVNAVVSIRSSSYEMCDHVRIMKVMQKIQENPDLMKF